MSEKIFKVILKVDLHCSDCNKKIKKTLCKLQDREKIQSVVYDEKNNTVTITGPFDPKKLLTKICCKACKVINDIQIEEVKPKPEPKKPELAPEPEPQKVDPAPPAPEPVVKPCPCPVPVWTPGSGGCCCRPWLVAYYGGCRCCSCGWIYEPVSKCPPPPPTHTYGCGGQCCDGPRTCEFIFEEQPAACRIM